MTRRNEHSAGDIYDAVVVGAGPGGAAAAAFMAREGLQVLLLDKATFPRDKICGDAISGKSMGVMRKLGIEPDPGGAAHTPIWGVTFGGPGGEQVSIPFSRREDGELPGFVCKRVVFDRMIAEAAADAGADLQTGAEVRLLRKKEGRVVGVGYQQGGRHHEAAAPIVVGADGAYSVVARELGYTQLRPNHYVAGLRAYYEGMGESLKPGYIELHFVDELLPGYFWIFGLPGGAANVGVGMLSSAVKERGVRLKSAFEQVVRHERFAARFAGARRTGAIVGWGLPLGSKPRKMAGDGWMLVGDAASLIDPFTGEGIGNAMLSGMMSAEWALEAHKRADFSASLLSAYEHEVRRELRSELRLSHALQRMLRWRGLVDLVIRKASRSDELAEAISCMFDDLGARRRLLSPRFYLNVITA